MKSLESDKVSGMSQPDGNEIVKVKIDLNSDEIREINESGMR